MPPVAISFTSRARIASLAGLTLGVVLTAPAMSPSEQKQEPACVENLLEQKQNSKDGAQANEEAHSTNTAAPSVDRDGDGTVSREDAEHVWSPRAIDAQKEAGFNQAKS